MKQATFFELRNHAREYFDMVEAGEAVRIVRNGKPIADIVPIQQDLTSWKRRIAQPLIIDGVSISRMILEERETALRNVSCVKITGSRARDRSITWLCRKKNE
jgi:prevent-host-death family protein